MTSNRLLLLPCALAALAGLGPAAAAVPARYVVDVRVIEVGPDGSELEATQVEEEVGLGEVANLYVWWGKHDGAGGPVEAVAEGMVGDQPLLGPHAWAVVWQVQASIIDKEGLWSVGLRLNRAHFDGLGANGRPNYRRSMLQQTYVDPAGNARRWEMMAFDDEHAAQVGVKRVLLELRVTPVPETGS